MEISSYISEKKKKRKKRRAIGAIVVAFIGAYVVLAGTGWIVLKSPLFALGSVVVEGNSTTASSDVLAVLQSSALRDHSFIKSILTIKDMLVWPDQLSSSEMALLPDAAAISIGKSYFTHTITADVTERTSVGIWCFMPQLNAAGDPMTNESCYFFDASGTLFEHGFDTEGGSLFAIHDYSQKDPGMNGTILSGEFIPNLISILNVIQTSGVDVQEIALNDIGLQEIDVTTYNGPAIYFSLRFSADEDLPVLQNIMNMKGFSKLQYIDFRVQNRAYYK